MSAPLVAELEQWMRAEQPKLARQVQTAQAIDYMLKRWEGFARFLEDSRICRTNDAAERALRGLGARPKGLALRRSGPRGHVHPDLHLKVQRCGY
ncbi:IS66 family transposase [Bosea vestrisii]|uniref:IS66 family transposase n=1 Tax=Bosea vestrisii TaxID=151416 RepID=UPI003D7695A2